jgi:hypothetical protein
VIHTFDKDRMNNADFKRVGMGAMAVVSRLQDFPPEVRVLALAAVFAQVCKLYKVRPMDAMDTASRVAERKGQSDELRAVNMYVEKEMKK